jgi:hypothetical protein
VTKPLSGRRHTKSWSLSVGWRPRVALRMPLVQDRRNWTPAGECAPLQTSARLSGASAGRSAPAIYEKGSVKGWFFAFEVVDLGDAVRSTIYSGSPTVWNRSVDVARKPTSRDAPFTLRRSLFSGTPSWRGAGSSVGRHSAFDRFFVSCSPAKVGIQVGCWLSE